MPQGSGHTPQRSGGRRASSDLVRLYLQDIGRVDLLSHEEELTLARLVQRREKLLRERIRLASDAPALAVLVELENARQRLASQLGHWPSVQQWAEARELTVADLRAALQQGHEAWAERSGLSVAEIKQALHQGRRARDRMIQANLRLVVAVAKKYQQRGMELLDLVQEGTLGLERAVEKYDPTRGFRFSTYAYWWIRQSVNRWIDLYSRTIAIPGSHSQLLAKVEGIRRRLTIELGQMPGRDDLAEAVGISGEQLDAILMRAQLPLSLDRGADDDEKSDLADFLGDLDLDPAEEETQQEQVTLAGELLAAITPQQRRVVEAAFGIGQPAARMAEIAQREGLKARQAHALYRSALAAMERSRHQRHELQPQVVAEQCDQLALITDPSEAPAPCRGIVRRQVRGRSRRVCTPAQQLELHVA